MSKAQVPLESIDESGVVQDGCQPRSSPVKPSRDTDQQSLPRTRPYQDVNSSPLRNSPAVRSPVKPLGASPLPPVRLNSLNISKRRRLELEPSSPIDASHILNSRRNSESHITPQKARSFSTPVRFMGRRTPSLQDKPIPVLSPPSPEASLESAVVKSSSPLQNTLSSSRLLNSASSSSSASSGDERGSPLVVSRRRVTAPIFSSPPKRVEGDAELDRQIQNWKCLVSVAKKAYDYEDSEDEVNIDELIEKHRKAAQKAAAYLLEEGQTRSEEVGIEEFARHLTEQRDRFNEPFDDFNTSRLSRLQLKEYEELKRCYAARRSSAAHAAETASSQLDMRRLLGILDVDYDLLFP
ncbi:hypothetical protein TRVA0_002S01706 [Trichomonascus vanleenenianus]|uniref:uncharacterized protein n=1 Tax=Trichomonascus vanleenenianus TaxID=2268995 RepID=UPI003EC98D26